MTTTLLAPPESPKTTTTPTPLHPVVTVRGQVTGWKPNPTGMTELALAIEIVGDPIGRAAISALNANLYDVKNPALGVVGYGCEDHTRPHFTGSFKWTGNVPKGQAVTLVVWSRMGQMRTVPLFENVSVEGSFLLKDRQATLEFGA